MARSTLELRAYERINVIMLIVSTFLNKDIFVANFQRKSRYIQIPLFGTLQIKKEYGSYFYLPIHKADILKQALILNNFVKLAKLAPNCMFWIASASSLL